MRKRWQVTGGWWQVAIAVFWLICTVQAELAVSLKPEVESRFVYEPFTLLLEADQPIEPPEIPTGTGFSVMGITEVQTNRFRIELIAEESGTLTLPPFTVRSGDESVRTPLLRLAVDTPRRATEMHISVQFSATRAVTDQPVEMTVTWSSKVSFTRCHALQLELPVLNNPDWDIYPLNPGVPENERIGLPVNNQRVIARRTEIGGTNQLVFSFMLIPRKAGVSAATKARLNCALMQDKKVSSQYPSYFDNHFFNRPEKGDRFERLYLSAACPELTVQALPETGRTARYSGIVGNCTAITSIRPEETVVGQPMLLTVELNNLSFGPGIPALPEAVLEGIGSEFQLTRRPLHETAARHSRSFTYVLRPLRSGITTVPALALQIFDPKQKTYRIVRTDPLNIQVRPDGKTTFYQPSAGEDRKPKTPLNGIRGNRKESELTMKTYALFEFLARNAWALWLLPPLLWLALRPWIRRRDRCRTDPAYARARRAVRNFRRAVRQDEETAWKNYLADRFDLNADAVTFETVSPKLEKQNAGPELLQAVRNRFVRHDTKHYAPEGTPPRKAPSAAELVRKIEKAVPLLLLLFICLPADGRAEKAEQRFEQAMQIRAEKPDEAQPLFTEAALGFEADKQFFNAGNSWFFAGENGRALANYLSAERRRPFNRQIRESIAFIRAQRTDSFQGLENPASKVSKAWKKFCRWHPAIRGGLLTIIYLTGWAVFLIARFFGSRIPRRIWIGFGIMATVPALSLVWSAFQPMEGVVIQPAAARLGPGYAYDKAYETLLHEATEFQWLESRDGWIRARLPDSSEAWLREPACQPVR